MRMNGTYAHEAKYSQKVDQKAAQNHPSTEYKVGQELEGIILKVSEQISIDFSGREVNIPQPTIPDAKEGEIRKFKITEISNNGIVLKEIGSATKQSDASKINGMICTKTETDPSTVLATEEKEEEEKENGLEGISSKMTASNLEDIKNEGVSLESYQLELLAKALDRVKMQRSMKMDQLEGQTEQLKLEREQARNLASAFLPDNAAVQKIADSLVKADLPVTQDNVLRIANAMKLSSAVSQLGNASAAYLIRNELEPTIENIYKAVHSGETNPLIKKETEFNDITGFVEQMITEENMEDKESALKQAKWLFQSNLNVTKENIQYKIELDQLPKNLSMDVVADQAAQSVANGHKAEDALLLLQYRIRMEVARLKLSYDAQGNMASKGIKIDNEEIEKSVNHLKQLEQEFYKSYLGETTENLDDKIDMIEHTVTSVDDLKQAKATVLGQTFEQRHEITLIEFHDRAVTGTQKYQQAEESYEALMTAPRKDFGDSIQKAFQNVDSQLDLLGLETTKANQRAVRILGYNQIELTKDHITEMKLYDAKVNNLLQNMTPTVITAMVKEGVNPLNLPIDELTKVTKVYQEQLGDSKEVKFSEYLVDLESNEEITQEQREAYIGIYRLLHQVETSDGAAVGAVVKAGKEITLNALLTEVRTNKRGRMDLHVSEDQGTTESKGGYTNSITDSINRYYSELGDYQQSIVTSLLQNMDAKALGSVAVKYGNQLYDTSLEQLQEDLNEASTDTKTIQAERILNRIGELSKVGSSYLAFLDDYQIPDSIQNTAAVKNMIDMNTKLYEKTEKVLKDAESIRQYSKELLTNLDDFERFNTKYDAMNKEIISSIKEEVFTEDSQEMTAANVKDMNAICDMYSLNQQLQKKEFYNLPLELNDSVVNVNLTVIHDLGEKGKIRINLPTNQLGHITVEASLDQGQIKCLITSDSMAAIPKLRNEAANLSEEMKSIGFSMMQQHYSYETRSQEQFIYASGNIYKESQKQLENKRDLAEQEEKVNTNQLYQITKELLNHLSNIASKAR